MSDIDNLTDDTQQLEFGEVAAEMANDPLSNALFENAQYRVLVRKLRARVQLLNDRIDELTKQREK